VTHTGISLDDDALVAVFPFSPPPWSLLLDLGLCIYYYHSLLLLLIIIIDYLSLLMIYY
jgi:hypothetical protein